MSKWDGAVFQLRTDGKSGWYKDGKRLSDRKQKEYAEHFHKIYVQRKQQEAFEAAMSLIDRVQPNIEGIVKALDMVVRNGKPDLIRKAAVKLVDEGFDPDDYDDMGMVMALGNAYAGVSNG